MRGAQLAVACGLALTSCQPPDPTKPPAAKFHLEGSLTQQMDLGYDSCRIEFTENDLSVFFVRTRPADITLPDGGVDGLAANEDYAFQLTYALLGAEYPANATVDLAELVDPTSDAGIQRGIASRNVLNDPRKKLPLLQRGAQTLKGTLQPGSTAKGEFHVTFENGTEVASGRTVFGKFEAKVAQ